MDDFELILDQLTRTFESRAWHGPSFMDALKEVEAEEASMRLIDERHTIWEIVNHCIYWMEAVKKALGGVEMPRITPNSTEDWPGMGKDEQDWSKVLEGLKNTFKDLVASVEGFNRSRLEDIVSGRSYTYRNMLHGISDHNVYHAGQIAVFRKKD